MLLKTELDLKSIDIISFQYNLLILYNNMFDQYKTALNNKQIQFKGKSTRKFHSPR